METYRCCSERTQEEGTTMTTNLWIAWLLAATIAMTGGLAAASAAGSPDTPEPGVCGAVVDDGSPF
jgi:hypothetical protein